MFKAENTGTNSWKKVLDKGSEWVGNLHEQTTGWMVFPRNSLEPLTPTIFSNPSKALSWLNKNKEVLT